MPPLFGVFPYQTIAGRGIAPANGHNSPKKRREQTPTLRFSMIEVCSMHGLTKREFKITDPEQIVHILNTGKVLHLGLAVNDEPYVVPMNYGYVLEDGKLVLYLHSAVRGRKLDMIRANPKVFFTVDCDLQPFEGRVACQYGLSYSSVAGRGEARIVEDVEEKKKAMSVLMKTQTGRDFSFDDRLVSIVAVIRIDVEEYTAKHRPIPEAMR